MGGGGECGALSGLFFWGLGGVASGRGCNISDHFTALYSVSEVFTFEIN